MTDKAITPSTTEPVNDVTLDEPKPAAAEGGAGGGETSERAKLIALASGEKPANDPAKPAKGKPAKPGEEAKADADAKPGDEKKTPEELEKQKKAERRDYAKAHRSLKKLEATVTQREARVAETERTLNARMQEAEESFKKDPLGWIKSRGLNVKQVLLDLAKADGEDPKDKLLREVAEKADRADKKLSEREQREQTEAQKRAQAEAFADVRETCATDWKGADHDDYPFLSTFHEADEVAQFAAELQVAYYKQHRVELSPAEAFGRLEAVLRERDEKAQKARTKVAGKSNGAGASGTPDRDRAVKAANPENGRSRSTTQDVTSRDTRESSTVSGGENALRRKYEQLAGG